MSALLDDHLLRDILADDLSRSLSTLLRRHEPATTNLYLHRLCKSVVSARGGALTGAWLPERRRELGRRLSSLPREIQVVPMRTLAFRMAEIADAHRVSTLGAEAVAAAQSLGGPLCVWEGDDGPHIRSAAVAVGVAYRTLAR
ncbi:MAG: hypothetical protein HYX34_11550 [Actinobacteria bacterium]|nr:hypothetical protein [Actinomycetota bacterium]